MRQFRAIALGAALLSIAASTASAQVQIALRDGRVTLVAKDATVRQILTEWARVGQTKIVNVERIPGGPITLQFTLAPEEEVLDILLRSVSGYMAAPRAAAVANLSRYDRIMVLPGAPAPRTVSTAPTGPVFQQQQLAITPAPPDNDDQNQAAPSVVAPARGPIFQTFPQPQVLNPPANQAPTTTEQPPATAPATGAAMPVGVPRPGMVTPSPTPLGPPARPTPDR